MKIKVCDKMVVLDVSAIPIVELTGMFTYHTPIIPSSIRCSPGVGRAREDQKLGYTCVIWFYRVF